MKKLTLKEYNDANKKVSLAYSNQEIGDKEIQSLALEWETNTSLVSIYLSGNSIRAGGIKCLVRVLENNSNIIKVYLGGNKVGDEGAQFLAQFLKKNNSVTLVDLWGNEIGDEGAIYLAQVLEENSTIVEINLSANNIRIKGIRRLASALEKNSFIASLGLALDDFDKECVNTTEEMECLSQMLEKNNSITWINLCGWSADLVSHLTQGLEKNNSITTIVHRNNNELVNKVLERNRRLQQDFKNAIEENNLAKVEELVDKGVSLVGQLGDEYFDKRPLELATALKHEKIVFYLNEEIKGRIIKQKDQVQTQTSTESELSAQQVNEPGERSSSFEERANKFNRKSYIRYEVDGDGDCGYTAFCITRADAHCLIVENIDSVKNLILPAVREALLTESFLAYLKARGNVSADTSIEQIEADLEDCQSDLAVLRAYVDYDIQDKQIDTGWAHPCVLQALAQIQKVKLYLWQLDGNDNLIPHPYYPEIQPENSQQRTDLFFINGNHFERLEFLNDDEQKQSSQKRSADHEEREEDGRPKKRSKTPEELKMFLHPDQAGSAVAKKRKKDSEKFNEDNQGREEKLKELQDLTDKNKGYIAKYKTANKLKKELRQCQKEKRKKSLKIGTDRKKLKEARKQERRLKKNGASRSELANLRKKIVDLKAEIQLLTNDKKRLEERTLYLEQALQEEKQKTQQFQDILIYKLKEKKLSEMKELLEKEKQLERAIDELPKVVNQIVHYQLWQILKKISDYVKEEQQKQLKGNPIRCFISYVWEEDRCWVKHFADDLVAAGIVVLFNQNNGRTGQILGELIQQQIDAADFILVVGTAAYRAESMNQSSSGSDSVVAYENRLIQGRALRNAGENERVLPLILSGTAEDSLPNWLWSLNKMHINFNNKNEYYENIFALIKDLYHLPLQDPKIKTLKKEFKSCRKEILNLDVDELVKPPEYLPEKHILRKASEDNAAKYVSQFWKKKSDPKILSVPEERNALNKGAVL